MPQITVDHWQTLSFDRRAFAAELHELITKVIDTPLSDCKTRFRRIEEAFIGDGDPARAMVFLEIKIMDGRSPEAKAELSERILALLQRHAKAAPGDELYLAVDVVELDRRTYRRSHPAGR